MQDIVAFIRARLDKDEAAARAATAGQWRVDSETYAEAIYASDGFTAVVAGGRWGGEAAVFDTADALHIARHDPARVLREVEARRRTIDWHLRVPDPRVGYGLPDQCGPCYQEWPCHDVRELAYVWADHQNYREEWRPTRD